MLGGMEFLFECSTWYLTHSLLSQVRYQFENLKRSSISLNVYALFSVLCFSSQLMQPCGFFRDWSLLALDRVKSISSPVGTYGSERVNGDIVFDVVNGDKNGLTFLRLSLRWYISFRTSWPFSCESKTSCKSREFS